MLRTVRRNTELSLIVLGTLVTVGAYLLASLAEDATIPANIGPFLGIVLGLQLAAHIAIRKLAPDADGTLVPIAGLLNGLGYVFIVRIDEAKVDPQGLAGLQAAWACVGIVAFVGTLLFVRRVRDLEAYRWTIGFVGIALLLLPLVPGVGRQINGAKIWVGIGPVSFQPGEFAKILLALFFASYLVEKRELLAVSSFRVGPLALPDPKHLGPVLLAWGVSLVVMVSERDLGSSLLFFALFVALLWVSTERASYLVVGLVLFGAGSLFAQAQFSHVQDRVDIWLDPWEDPKDDGFQIVESSFAFSAGGVTGTGLNLGSPTRIPYAETDFIFAAIGEELGL
jgi:cell division protein FtsW (lipid II flippase)